MMNISICICTYNRSDSLRLTLDSLADIVDELHDGDEVLVIDNNSSDDTSIVVNRYEKVLPISYIYEQTQGLSSARNRALKEFKNPVLIFIDDDVIASQGFIKQYRLAFKRYQKAGFFGGKIFIDWLGDLPKWYQRDQLPLINGLLINYDLGADDRVYTSIDLLPYGANFALTRQLIDQVGLFDVELGVNGNEIGRGEESDYFTRALNLSYQGMYLANPVVGHRFDPERLQLVYLYRYGIEKGKCLTAKEKNSRFFHLKELLNYFFKSWFQLIKGRKGNVFQCVINMGIQHALLFNKKRAVQNQALEDE